MSYLNIFSNNFKSAGRVLREETNFMRGGLQISTAGTNAITDGYKKYAEQFIDAAIIIVTNEKENLPEKIKQLREFLL